MASFTAALTRGALAGLIAGVPQVALTQIMTGPLGLPREQADIGPRFVRRVTQRFVGTTPSSPTQWIAATIFHFGYAAQWGAVYALSQQWRRTPPLVGGPMLAALIYALAFSSWGAATQTGTERHPRSRPLRETLMHWTAALSFSLTVAYAYEWLRRRQASSAPVEDPLPTLPLEGMSAKPIFAPRSGGQGRGSITETT
jgi:hypothetical protein